MAVRDDDLISLGPWPGGINNLAPEDALPVDEDGRPIALRDAVNVNFDRQGRPSRRQGASRFYEGQISHSLWSAPDLPFGLFVDGGKLHAVFEDLSVEPLDVEVGGLPTSYELINDRVFYTNRAACGLVTLDLQAHSWAPAQPAGVPLLVASVGQSLASGLYQVVITFTDALGRESGCSRAAHIDVGDSGGIELTAIPQPTDTARTPIVNLYVTDPNDQVLRLAISLPAGITSWSVSQPANGRALTTQFLQPLPAGQITRLVNGRQFVAVGREILYSEPLRYGLYHPVRNRIRFKDGVDLMEPIGKEGLLVASGKRTYWLSGSPNPAEWGQVIRRGAGAVPYSAVRVPGTLVGVETTDDLPVWLSATGHFCVGTPGGQIMVIKESEAVVPGADRAAVLLRSEGGINQLVAALRGPRTQGLAVSDRLVAHVIHTGDAGQ